MNQPSLATSNQPSRCLIILSGQANEQQLEEAVAMSLVLASFDHNIQLALCEDTKYLCQATTHKVHKMLSSFELYDIPPLWLILRSSIADYQSTHQNITKTCETLDIQLKSTNELPDLLQQFDTVMMF